jgi:hypothetical protein
MLQVNKRIPTFWEKQKVCRTISFIYSAFAEYFNTEGNANHDIPTSEGRSANILAMWIIQTSAEAAPDLQTHPPVNTAFLDNPIEASESVK